jgi:hypothetical protein
MLTRLAVGFALTAAVASVNCGGDDTNGTTTGTGGAGGGTGGAGGTAGTGGAGGTEGGTGGTTGTGGGTGGTTGTGGGTGGTEGGVRDGGGDGDGGLTGFAAVQQIFQTRCMGCHNPNFPNRIDLTSNVSETGQSLYARLTSALPNNQEGQCAFNPPPAEGGAEAGEAGSEAGEAGETSVRANRTAIVANSLPNSYLYQKINGTQDGKDIAPPAGCGARMPRLLSPAPDAGDSGATVLGPGCDQTDAGLTPCLSNAQIQTVANWITSGATEN